MKLLETNHTINNTDVKIQIQPGCYPIQLKARPIPCHLQDDVKNELDRLIKSGHLERSETIEEDGVVSPVVNTVKKQISRNHNRRPESKRELQQRGRHCPTWTNY